MNTEKRTNCPTVPDAGKAPVTGREWDAGREPDAGRDLAMAGEIARRVDQIGGRTYYVGGYVRDQILGIDNKDIDIEIHGITPVQLTDILDELGQRMEMGVSFGVYGLKGYGLDIAMPRTEKAVGRGHKDFEVSVDPYLGTEKAAKRRDFTINALMQDVMTGRIVDHYSGLDDLEKGYIRHVCADTFVEDPLRVFRGAQFAARFQYEIAPETIELCRGMDLSALARERVFEEMKKALLKADKPSIFFEELRKMGQLTTWFPEVEELIGVEQNHLHHLEGDVWVHTMMVVDQAAKRREKVAQPLPFMLSALCHDFGKIVATEEIDGELHAYDHEHKGLPLVERFLNRLTSEKYLIDYVINMVGLHMKPHILAWAGSSVKKTNRMYDEAMEPYDLVQLAEADNLSAVKARPYVSNEPFLLERLSIYQEYMARPYVMGRDLIEAGMKPGKDFTEILDYAHKMRLAGVDKESALKQTLSYGRMIRRKPEKKDSGKTDEESYLWTYSRKDRIKPGRNRAWNG